MAAHEYDTNFPDIAITWRLIHLSFFSMNPPFSYFKKIICFLVHLYVFVPV